MSDADPPVTGWTARGGLALELERVARNLRALATGGGPWAGSLERRIYLGAVHGDKEVSSALVELAHQASELAKRVDQ